MHSQLRGHQTLQRLVGKRRRLPQPDEIGSPKIGSSVSDFAEHLLIACHALHTQPAVRLAFKQLSL
jgi:hypothetical protein